MAIDWERVVAVSDDGSVESFGIERIILVTGQKGDKGDKGDKGERGDLDSLVWGNIIGNIINQQDLINYIEQSHPTIDAYTKEETDDFIDDLQDQIDNINNFKIHPCVSGEYDTTTHIPTIQNPDTTTFYLVPTGTENDIYEEWIYLNNNWERFGSAKIDLSSYYTKTETDALLDEKADTTDVTSALALKADASAVYTKQESDTLLNAKANSTDVTTALALKADKPEISITGSSLHFEDGADNIPLKSFLVNFEPKQSGSGTPSSSNIRPISGWDSVTINHSGTDTSNPDTNKIYFNVEPEIEITTKITQWPPEITWENDHFIVNGQLTYNSPNRVMKITLPKGTYKFTTGLQSSVTGLTMAFGQTKTDTDDPDYGNITITPSGLYTSYELNSELEILVTSESCRFEFILTVLDYYHTTFNNVIITPQFIPTNALIYAGNVDVLNGVLTQTMGYISSYNGESLPGRWVSDRDVYTQGGTPTTGAQVAYELANPIIYDTLTPVEIKTLLGVNNFWSDANSMSMTYVADIGLYISSLVANKADASSVYTKTETNTFINNLQNQIDNLNSFDIHICVSGEYDPTTLIPTIANPDSSTVYLVSSGDGNDLYDEWIYVNNRWEKFGSARIDLSDYVTKEQLTEEINIENNYESENGVLVVQNTSSTDKIDEIICHYPPSLTGINWLEVNIYNKNLIQSGRTYVNPSTQKGVTFTTNTDGSISFSGTPTEDIDIMCDCDTITLPVGRYILSGGIDENNYIYIGNNTIKSTGNDRSCTVNVKGWFSVHLCIKNTGNQVSGTFYPMIRHESISDNTYVKGEKNNSVFERIGKENNPINIYGGYYNFVTAQLTVTHKHIDSYNGEALPGEWISDRDTYSPGTTPTIGASVTYELAEPEISIEDTKWVNVHANEEVSVFMSNYFNEFSVKMNQKLKDVINTLKQNKQDKLTFDNTPSSGSTNPVTSNGIATALALKADKTDTYTKTETDTLLDSKQDTITFDNVPTAGSNNPVKSSGIKGALDEKANSTDVYTKTESDALLDAKENTILKSASGAIASFDDGVEAPAAHVVAKIEPVQDLHGYDNPWPAGGGKNLCNITNFTATSSAMMCNTSGVLVSAGTYTVSFDFTTTASDRRVQAIITSNSTVSQGTTDPSDIIVREYIQAVSGSRNSITITTAQTGYFYLRIVSENGTASNIQLELGSSATSFTPYSNICPITGWTGVNITRTGKNLCPVTNWQIGQYADGIYISNEVKRKTSPFIRIKPNTEYIISIDQKNTADLAWINYNYFDANQNWLGNRVHNGDVFFSGLRTKTFIIYNTNARYIRLTVRSYSDIDKNISKQDVSTGNPQLELGSTATAYESYQGDTYTITFPSSVGTVYGGELDVTSGKLTVTHKVIDLSTIETWESISGNRIRTNAVQFEIKGPSNSSKGLMFAENYQYMSNKNLADDETSIGISVTTNGYVALRLVSGTPEGKFVYELATPITYQLTPTEITTLLSQNNIWADTGDIAVDYFRNKKLADAIDNTIVDYEKQVINKPDTMVTDNIELTSTATQNYTAGSLAIVQNQLIRVTQNIATGGAITIGSNAETVDLETLIAEKAEKILVAKLPFLSSAELYNNTADFHNAMPRGKDITSYLTDGSLWDRINGANGYSLFEDLYVGDYLTADGQQYMIVDLDYYIRCGDGMDITQHHLVMMPTGNMSIPEGTVLYGSEDTLTLINTANYREHTGDDTVTVTSQETATAKKWNATIDSPNTNTTAGGYKFSRMRQVIMKAADTIVVNAFGSAHIKPIPVIYPNPANAEASGLASNWTWYKDTDWTSDLRRSICDLPNETQIYGQQVWGRGSAWNTGGYEVGVDKWQFALFKNNRARANIRANWWLRSVYSAAYACNVNNNGAANTFGTSSAIGVRPRFLLFG